MKRLNELTLFLILLVCYTYFFPRWQDQNVNSRLDMVVAVVDDGTFVIDKYAANTVDYAKVGEHRYSDKAPGTAFLGIPVYAGLKVILNSPTVDRLTDRLANSESFRATLRESGSGVLKQKVRFALAQVVLSFVLIAVPAALLGVLMFRLLGCFVSSDVIRWAVVLGYGLLTPAFAYANSFVGHQLVAALLFAAFYILFMHAPTPRSLLITGALLGYSVITEYPSILIVLVLMAYALHRLLSISARSDRSDLSDPITRRALPMLWLIAPMALCAIGLMAYNTAIFGGPLKLGYENSELWKDKHSQGFLSLTFPHLDALWGITFGIFRGLFVLSPVLLLAVPGFWVWLRRRQFRAEAIVCLLATLSMFLFNSSSNMWWGGWSIGPRYLLPALPFMAVAMVFALQGKAPAQTRFFQKTWFVGAKTREATDSFMNLWLFLFFSKRSE